VRADVAEPLHRHGAAFEIEVLLLGPLDDADDAALARGLGATEPCRRWRRGLPGGRRPSALAFCAEPTMFGIFVSIIHAMVWLLVPTSGAGNVVLGSECSSDRRVA